MQEFNESWPVLCVGEIHPIFKVSELPEEVSTSPWDPKISGWSPPPLKYHIPTGRKKESSLCWNKETKPHLEIQATIQAQIEKPILQV